MANQTNVFVRITSAVFMPWFFSRCRQSRHCEGTRKKHMRAGPMIRLAIAFTLVALASLGASAASPEKATSVVLVHGAFVDGSGWKIVESLAVSSSNQGADP